MLNIVIAMGAAALLQGSPATAVPAQAAPATAAAPALTRIPGVTVTYYQVVGTNDKGIRKSIEAQRPKGPDGEPVLAGTSWEISAKISKRTEDGNCTISSVTPVFSGTAVLPRLATPTEVDPQLLSQWNASVARLEAISAARLAFVHDQLDEVKQAVAASTCDAAGDALNAALERLKAREAAFLQQQAARIAAEEKAAAEARKAEQKSGSE